MVWGLQVGTFRVQGLRQVLSGQCCVKDLTDVDERVSDSIGAQGSRLGLESRKVVCCGFAFSPRKCTGDFLKDSYSERLAEMSVVIRIKEIDERERLGHSMFVRVRELYVRI